MGPPWVHDRSKTAPVDPPYGSVFERLGVSGKQCHRLNLSYPVLEEELDRYRTVEASDHSY